MKWLDKIINGVLIFTLVGSITWFLIYEHKKFNIPEYKVPIETVEQPNKIDWAPLIPGVSSIAIFFLRYFLIERKKKKSKLTPLSDHLFFDTLEDMIENELKHKTFGSEGRTEAMRTMISIQLNEFKEGFKEFIVGNPSFDNGADFRKKLRTCIYKIVDEIDKKWKDRQLPQPLIDKYSALYRQRIDLLLSDVLSSTFMASMEDNEALDTFLNDARIVIRSGLLEDVIMALTALNGELNGLTFNGKEL